MVVVLRAPAAGRIFGRSIARVNLKLDANQRKGKRRSISRYLSSRDWEDFLAS